MALSSNLPQTKTSPVMRENAAQSGDSLIYFRKKRTRRAFAFVYGA